MALKKLYIGTVGPFLYDDTDLIDDEDGDFAGETHKGIVTDGQLIVEKAPTDPNHVMRKTDEYNPGGSDTDITVVTVIQVGGAGEEKLQYKTRNLTIDGGIVKVVGAESAWIDI